MGIDYEWKKQIITSIDEKFVDMIEVIDLNHSDCPIVVLDEGILSG